MIDINLKLCYYWALLLTRFINDDNYLGKQLIQAQQMLMDLTESEHTLNRVAALQKQLAQRRRQLEERKGTIRGLEEMFNHTEVHIAALGSKWKQLMVFLINSE